VKKKTAKESFCWRPHNETIIGALKELATRRGLSVNWLLTDAILGFYNDDLNALKASKALDKIKRKP
jgi:hypothetical protein